MRQHILLRLVLALALLSAVVPLSLDAAARPEQAGSAGGVQSAASAIEQRAHGELGCPIGTCPIS